MKILKKAVLLAALLNVSGCSTMLTLSMGDKDPYSGVRASFEFLQSNGVSPVMTKEMAVIDLPFTFVADTILVPVQIIRTIAD